MWRVLCLIRIYSYLHYRTVSSAKKSNDHCVLYSVLSHWVDRGDIAGGSALCPEWFLSEDRFRSDRCASHVREEIMIVVEQLSGLCTPVQLIVLRHVKTH